MGQRVEMCNAIAWNCLLSWRRKKGGKRLKMGWKVVGDAVRGGTRHLILLLMLPVLFDVDGYGEDGEVRPVTGSNWCRNLKSVEIWQQQHRNLKPFLWTTVSASGYARILCQGGAQVWRREKTKNNKCISYQLGSTILLSTRHCIRPVCHSHIQ